MPVSEVHDGAAPRPGRGRRRVAVAAAVVLGLGGASTVGYALGHQQSPPQPAASATIGGAETAGGAATTGGAGTTGTTGAAAATGLSELAPPAPAPQDAPDPASVPPVRGPVLAAATPTSLTIPTIGVSSAVAEVGLNPDTTMEVPQPGPLYDRAAWFRGSPMPGELGPSVIIGHVDSAKDGPSVFFKLGEVKPGQRIDVGRADGTTAVFNVVSVASYPKDAFPLQTVYGDTDNAALRLITCGGAFSKAKGSYRDNIVVFADLVQ